MHEIKIGFFILFCLYIYIYIFTYVYVIILLVDVCSGTNLVYHIPPGVAGDMFTVDNTTGEVTTTAPLSWLLQTNWIITGLFIHHTFKFTTNLLLYSMPRLSICRFSINI